MRKKRKNSRVVVVTLCASIVMCLNACDRSDSTGGTTEDSIEDARDHLKDAGEELQDAAKENRARGTNDTKDLDRTRDELKDATKDVGRGLERTGEDIQDASRDARNP
ncbi:MAG TPA: hypothetical protein VN673_06385 [Clostridia bacterium]|nr:hypothetical protein [Clostridia bacterium]